ncbi:MAG: hypothetical protein EOO10_09075 [Chitinophagaceae bacterium]|nr:MAG: hypothetical protein EOO10_09075 [Chitinophagaceae bacterium]
MAKENNSRDTAYNERTNTEPSKQTGNINARNNNTAVSTPGPDETTVENAANEGIGDKALNDRKLTDYTSNHSADA